ncbi:hypothetical protein MKZ38_005001 [Zalerion maritima]|uniref:Nephrocystin 3-like N-terminal domain-containing protein n=1 Tax=Zalerion maritima TaxID=339359 RepID=A0AAD5RKU2_9PEZI|nr:hypothetical protein MKZ38_005001 [Zalerion maritima]
MEYDRTWFIMAKRTPNPTVEEMEKELGYTAEDLNPSASDIQRIYTDLRPVVQSDRVKRDFDEHRARKQRKKSKTLTEPSLTQDLDHIHIELASRHGIGLYRFEADIMYDLGVNLHMLLTEDEAQTMLRVTKVQPIPNASQSPLLAFPREIRDRIYRLAIPNGKCIIKDFDNLDGPCFAGGLADPSGFYFSLSSMLSVLSLNVQTRQESLPFAYRKILFCLGDMDDLVRLLVAIDQKNAEEREAILDWLSTLDFRERQENAFQKHHKGTGRWMLDTKEFRHWFNGKENSSLWCPGIPGAGKTVIIRSIAINHVAENMVEGEDAIAYIYCQYKDPRTRSEVDILSSISRQLAEKAGSIEAAKELHDKCVPRFRTPTIDEKAGLIRLLSRQFRRTFIFLDALDECPEDSRVQLLETITKLEPSLRLFFTSRPHVQLDERALLAKLQRVDIVAHKAETTSYIENEISKNARLKRLVAKDPTLKRDIIRSVNTNADGMFLLVFLQMNRLRGCNLVKTLRAALAKMPAGVDEFYANAFERIEENNRMICHAFILDPETLFTQSAGLIAVDLKSRVVSLVHHTLQEYLASHQEILAADPEAELARVCLGYLSLDEFSSGPCREANELEQRLEKYQFLDYASHNWGCHAQKFQLHEKLTELIPAFLEDENKISSAVQVSHAPQHRAKGWHRRFPRKHAQVHVAAYWGLDKIIVDLCQESDEVVNFQDSDGWTPLQLACQRGHFAASRLLLEKGACVDTSNNSQETAILWVAKNGHEDLGGHTGIVNKLLLQCLDETAEQERKNRGLLLASEIGSAQMVQMLMDVSVEVNWKDEEGNIALTWAIPNGHENAARVLLQNGANVHSRDNYQNTPLHWAITSEKLAQVLLDHGADINAKNNTDKTPLIWSALDDLADSMRALVRDRNCDVNSQDTFGFTALRAAALKGYEQMVVLLLERGADPNMRDNDGWTPLHAAAVAQREGAMKLLVGKTVGGEEIVQKMRKAVLGDAARNMIEHMAEEKSEGSTVVTGLRTAVNDGHVRIIMALLETGANIDREDVGGSTALTLTAWLCRDNVVTLLLDNGAGVDVGDRNGRTALHYAAIDGYDSVAKILVEAGATVDAQIHGWTAMLIAAEKGYPDVAEALHWAARGGTQSTVQLLVEKGAKVNATDRWGRTALFWAIEAKTFDVVMMLLRRGANIHVTACDGATALHAAAVTGNLRMVQELVERGARVDMQTRDRVAPLDVASSMPVIAYLRNKGATAANQSLNGVKMEEGEFNDWKGGFRRNLAVQPWLDVDGEARRSATLNIIGY